MKEVTAKRNREMNQIKKEKAQKERKIRTLEDEKRQRDLILKRKQEEVTALRKLVKPVSGTVSSNSASSRATNSSLTTSATFLVAATAVNNPSKASTSSIEKSGKEKKKRGVGVESGVGSKGAGANVKKSVLTTGKPKSPRSNGAKLKWQNIEKNIMTIVRSVGFSGIRCLRPEGMRSPGVLGVV